MSSLPNVLYPTVSNANHAAPGMMYAFDSAILITGNGQTVTGGWRPVSPNDFSTNISLTGGTFNAAVDDVAVTGGQITVNGAVGISGTVTTNEVTFSTVTTTTLSGSAVSITTGVALPSTPTRNAFYVQVVGSGSPLFVLYGAGTTSATNFSVLLKADSSLYGGNGGVLTEDDYTGPVSVSGGAGCLFTIWQA